VKILLDTCTFLWLIAEPEKVPASAQAAFADPENDVFLSVVSGWEMSVKYAAGRLELPQPPAICVPADRKRYGVISLSLDEESAAYPPRLPKLHADPFDRMLICQSIVHGMTILTPDPLILQYPVRTIW
jgi:PIN domain nuclease of toxin-antitoxin system